MYAYIWHLIQSATFTIYWMLILKILWYQTEDVIVNIVYIKILLPSHVWLCNPMDCNMQSFPVLHCLLELAQTRVHWVGDAIQSSHPLPSPSLPTLNLSQHQALFQWLGSSPQSFRFSISPSNEYSDWFHLGSTGWISLQSKGTLKSLLQHHSPKAHDAVEFNASWCRQAINI